MTWREGTAYLIAVASLLAATVFYRQMTSARRDAERAGEEAVRRAGESQKQTEEAKRRADEAEQALELARLEVSAPATAAPESVPPTPPAPGMAPTVITLGPKEAANSPAVKDGIRKGMRVHIEQVYKDLMDSWGLQGEAREKMIEILIDRQLALMSPGEGTPEERRRKADEILAQRLTAQQLAALQEYDRTAGERAIQKEAENEISGLGLDPTRMWPLRDIIIEERRNEREATGRALAAFSPSQDAATLAAPKDPTAHLMKILEVKREANERVLQRARPLLTDAEYEGLRKQREAQLKILDLSIQMMNASKETPKPK